MPNIYSKGKQIYDGRCSCEYYEILYFILLHAKLDFHTDPEAASLWKFLYSSLIHIKALLLLWSKTSCEERQTVIQQFRSTLLYNTIHQFSQIACTCHKNKSVCVGSVLAWRLLCMLSHSVDPGSQENSSHHIRVRDTVWLYNKSL